jgi:hypothetical protein
VDCYDGQRWRSQSSCRRTLVPRWRRRRQIETRRTSRASAQLTTTTTLYSVLQVIPTVLPLLLLPVPVPHRHRNRTRRCHSAPDGGRAARTRLRPLDRSPCRGNRRPSRRRRDRPRGAGARTTTAGPTRAVDRLAAPTGRGRCRLSRRTTTVAIASWGRRLVRALVG